MPSMAGQGLTMGTCTCTAHNTRCNSTTQALPGTCFKLAAALPSCNIQAATMLPLEGTVRRGLHRNSTHMRNDWGDGL